MPKTEIDRWKLETMEDAEALAAKKNEEDGTEDKWIATDSGPYVGPRFDVIARPQIGDKVSYAFNGDARPDGVITSISKGPAYRRIQTSTGRIYWRKRQRGAWINEKTWGLVPGHIEKRNPHL